MITLYVFFHIRLSQAVKDANRVTSHDCLEYKLLPTSIVSQTGDADFERKYTK